MTPNARTPDKVEDKLVACQKTIALGANVALEQTALDTYLMTSLLSLIHTIRLNLCGPTSNSLI